MPEHRVDPVEIHEVGPHRVEIERPDVFHIHYSGDIDAAHFKAFGELIQTIPAPIPIYLLRDARNGGIHKREAREDAARKGEGRLAAIVTYGSSFHGRTLFTMLNKATRILDPRIPIAVFFETEADARAWIAKHRSQSRPTNTP
jgi:hypothetical protein